MVKKVVKVLVAICKPHSATKIIALDLELVTLVSRVSLRDPLFLNLRNPIHFRLVE